jgi:cytochrome bd ubiquinol oxidase subunit II
MSVLSIIWFGLAALLLAIWAIADGFDLGAGVVYGFTKDPARRKLALASISHIWSGNEVWLLAGVGSLLAAFPPVYSSLLSSLYVPMILVLMAIVARACGVELRGKTDSAGLQRFLDGSIVVGSLVPAWGVGLAAGNVLVGLPIDAAGNLQGSWLFFLHPFALATSLLSLAAFTLHGSLYVAMKTVGPQRDALVAASKKLFLTVAALVAVCAVAGVFVLGPRLSASGAKVGFWIFAVLTLVGYGGVIMDLGARRLGGAFAASGLGILSMVGASACLLFPVLIPSRLGAGNDLTVALAASSDKSLLVMLILACIAVPLAAVYAFIAYRSFRGASKPGEY